VKLSHWQKINSVSDDEKLPVATENAEDILLQKMTFFNFQRKVQCLFQAFLRVGRGNSPPHKKTYNFPQMAAKLCALDLFLASTVNYKCAVETFFWWTRNTRKLFVIKQSKWCKFMPKMQQNTTGSGALPGPSGVAYMLSKTS